MKKIQFSSVKIPAIGMGTWHMGSNPSQYATEKATIQAGLDPVHGSVIDTAETYGSGDSEKLVGDAIQNFPRQKLFLISKFTPDHATPALMKRSLAGSLKRLGTDYLDLYLYHWPGPTPLPEVVKGLEALRQSGKIKHWGVSNFSKAQMEKLLNLPGGSHVFANEICYNVTYRNSEYGLLPWMRAHKIPMIAYSPVAGSGYHNVSPSKDGTLNAIAKQHHASPFQIMLAWAIRDGHTLAIPQTSSQAHLQDNLRADQIKLSRDDEAAIDRTFQKPTSAQPVSPFL